MPVPSACIAIALIGSTLPVDTLFSIRVPLPDILALPLDELEGFLWNSKVLPTTRLFITKLKSLVNCGYWHDPPLGWQFSIIAGDELEGNQ